MKLVKKIMLLSLLVMFSINSNATNKAEVLANKMINNPLVMQLIKNKISLSVVNGVSHEYQSSKVFTDKLIAVKNDNLILENLIRNQYPEFINLDELDRIEVVTRIFNSPAVSERWTCVKNKVTVLASEILGVGAVSVAIALFRHCVMAALVVDIIGVLSTGGAGVLAEATAAVPEVALCKYLAIGTAGVEFAVVMFFLDSCFSC